MLSGEGIEKKYKNPILKGLNLRAEGGEIIGIAGENGSGKSTLLSILTAVMYPNKGRVTVEGEDIFKNPKALRKWIGYVPQENSLFDNLSAMDNIRLWASVYGADWKNALPFLFPEHENHSKKEEKAYLKKKAGRMSGGMKKRLSIALSLMHSPKYLIMDEPTAGLDIHFKWNLLETMKSLRSGGKCVIFSSHQPDELLFCDRICVLRNGIFVYEGAPQNVLQDEGETKARTGTGEITACLYALITGRTRNISLAV